MRVLLVLEATLGGTARHVLDLAGQLAQRGYDVHLLHSYLRSDIQFTQGLERLRAHYPQLRLAALPMKRSLAFSDLRCWRGLRRYLKQNGPFDVIHAHSTKAGFLARLLWTGARTKKFYTPHALLTQNPSVTGWRRWMVALLERSLARLTGTVIVLSQEEEREARRIGIKPERLVRIPNGVDCHRLAVRAARRNQIRQRLGIDPGQTAIGLVGRLCYQKDPELALRAFAAARSKTQANAVLVIVGSGALEQELRRTAVRLQVSSQIIWTGEIDAAAHMAAFDILLHSSRFEGMSYVFLEALASGVPVVTTRVGGVEELIHHGTTGFVCDDRDPASLAHWLLRLMDEHTLLSRMSVAARRHAQGFDLSLMVEKLEALYRGSHAGPVQAAAPLEAPTLTSL